MTLMQIYTQTRNDEPHSLKASTTALLQEGRVVFSWRRKGQKGLYGHSRAGIARAAVFTHCQLRLAKYAKNRGHAFALLPFCRFPSAQPELLHFPLGQCPFTEWEGGRAGGGKEEEYTRGGKEGVQCVCILARSPSLPSFLPLFLAKESAGNSRGGARP